MSPPDAALTELPTSPGARLRHVREARGMTEQQAAESLNLDPAVVAQLEADDFNALGAPVFVKGHLRRYSALLELDAEQVVASYERSKQQVEEPTLVPRARLEMAPVRGRPRWPWVVGGTATFLVAAAAVAYLSDNGLPWSSEVEDADPSTEVLSASVGPVSGPAPAAGVEAAPPVVPAPAPAIAAATEATTAPVAPGPGQVSLQLRFNGDSWVEIFDGTGKAVLYDLGRKGSDRTLTAAAPLSVTLGNAPAVAIVVNGRAQSPPGAQGQVARFSIGADGLLR